MAAANPEEAFLASLFAGLDSTTFDDLPSSPPLPSSSRIPRPPRGAHLPSSQPQPRPSSSQSKPVRPVASRSKTLRPAAPKPFWDSPSRGAVKVKNGVRGVEVTGQKRARANSPVKRVVRHVVVAVEGKENPLPLVDVKGKGREVVKRVKIEEKPVERVKVEEGEVDFDALLEGMDWEEEMVLSQEEKKVPVIPHSKRYLRCTVEEIVQSLSEGSKRPVKTLSVRSKDVQGLRTVVLCDDWVDTPVEIGGTVNLIGPFSPSSTPSLTIDRLSNLLILHPDILVSSTKVADSSHCARKALLQELIRTVGGAAPPLVYGNMLHELMQACLSEDRWDDEWRKEKISEILKGEVQTLWSMDLSIDKAREEMMDKSKEFEAFKDQFVGVAPGPDSFLSDARTSDTSRARLAVTKTLDIEEDIWSPKYGLKGKIDVSITGRIDEAGVEGEPGTLPFEIKTGKSHAGMEHRAQTMLYTLLMSDRYDETIDSGLLYYSQANVVFRVKAARNEIRSLLITRNDFATYLHRRMNLSRTSGSWATQSTPREPTPERTITSSFVDAVEPPTNAHLEDDEDGRPLLPPPIDDARSCKWCYVSDACMLFRRAVEGETEISFDDEDPLQVAFENKTGHLTDEQATFFKSWEKLISLEEQELVRFKKEIWTMGAEERMKVGRCLANMAIDDSYEPPLSKPGSRIHRFTYRLQHAQPLASQATNSQRAARSLIGGNIVANDPVVVSLEHPSVLSISRGFVLEVTPHDIVLGLDHSLVDSPQAAQAVPRLAPTDLVFRIDKDELSAGMGRIRDNLIQLFVAGGDEKRRRLVVDLEAPEFDHVDSREKLIAPHLNPDQVRAVHKVLSARDYALVLGMPGTGKTTTIAEILKALAKAGKSVLLTSYTHSAVDNILLKVMDSGLSILRLGNRDKIMPVLHRYTLDPENKAETLEQLDKQLMEPQIVATTCLSINDPIFTRRQFDVCIVDEASQVTLPTCLGPLRFAKIFVLVGDHNQLPPLVRNPAARRGGLDVSLFKRLSDAHPNSLVDLTLQYRMNDDIMLLSNKLIYNDRLQAGSEAVATQKLELPRPAELAELRERCVHGGTSCWIADLLDADRRVVFVDTDLMPARERKYGPLIENEIEAQLVLQTTEALVACGVPQVDIGVIALYRQQIKLISRKLVDYPEVEVLTADRSQGRDKECILMSLTRSNTEGQVGDLLKDWRRINVCLTRAKSKLIVFGSRTTLANLPLLQMFFGIVEERGWIYQLPAKANEQHRLMDPVANGKEAKRELGSARRKGAEDLVLSQPLLRDVVNCL